MISLASGLRVFLPCGMTDMCKGIVGLVESLASERSRILFASALHGKLSLQFISQNDYGGS